MLDLTNNSASISLAEQMWRDGKIVSAICHGPEALVNVKDLKVENILNARKVASFSNVEEEQVWMTKPIP